MLLLGSENTKCWVSWVSFSFLRLGLFKVTLVRFGLDYLGFMVLNVRFALDFLFLDKIWLRLLK